VQHVTVTVNEANRPPALAPIADGTTIDEGALFSFTASATDPDVRGEQARLFPRRRRARRRGDAERQRGGLRLDAGREPGAGRVPAQPCGVSDRLPGRRQDVHAFTVSEVNNPPVFAPILPQSVNEGQPFTLTGACRRSGHAARRRSALFLEGDPARRVPPIESGSGTSSGPPPRSRAATDSIIVRATESAGGGLSSVQSFGLTVDEVNQAPVLGALKDFTVEEGSVVTFQATATDADLPKQALTYALTAGVPDGATIDPNSGVFVWTTPDDTGATTEQPWSSP
jgi:hypothetical protein